MDREILRKTLRSLRAERRRVRRAIFRLEARLGHASNHNLERYYLGMIPEGPELDVLEEHPLACPECVGRAEETGAYVDSIRAGIIKGNFERDRIVLSTSYVLGRIVEHD